MHMYIHTYIYIHIRTLIYLTAKNLINLMNNIAICQLSIAFFTAKE